MQGRRTIVIANPVLHPCRPQIRTSVLVLPHTGLPPTATFVRLALPGCFSVASPSRFLPAFVRGHDSKGLLVLRFGKPERLFSMLKDVELASSLTTGVSGAAVGCLSMDLVVRLVGGGVSSRKRCFAGVCRSAAFALCFSEDEAMGISMSVKASSSISSESASRSASCSSDGKSKRGLIPLLVRGRCAATPACLFSLRWLGASLRSVAADDARSSSVSWNLRKIFLPRLL